MTKEKEVRHFDKKIFAEAVSGSDFYNTLRSYCHLDSQKQGQNGADSP